MTRLLSPDRNCVQVDVPTGRATTRYSGRIIEVTDPGHARVLKEAGYVVSGGAGAAVRSGGYVCTGCGFHAFFTTCSRCGGTAVRPEPTTALHD